MIFILAAQNSDYSLWNCNELHIFHWISTPWTYKCTVHSVLLAKKNYTIFICTKKQPVQCTFPCLSFYLKFIFFSWRPKMAMIILGQWGSLCVCVLRSWWWWWVNEGHCVYWLVSACVLRSLTQQPHTRSGKMGHPKWRKILRLNSIQQTRTDPCKGWRIWFKSCSLRQRIYI